MLGSGEVARSYKAAGHSVKTMLQFDMTAWVKKGTAPRVGIVNDFVSPELSGAFCPSKPWRLGPLKRRGSLLAPPHRRIPCDPLGRHQVRM